MGDSLISARRKLPVQTPVQSQLAKNMPIRNQLLEDTATAIRVRPIPWDGYVRANLVAQADVTPFKALENLGSQQRIEAVDNKPEVYASLVVKLLSEVSREDLVKYWTLFVGDMVQNSKPFRLALLKESNLWTVLETLLGRTKDDASCLLVLRACATLATQEIAPRPFVERVLAAVCSKLSDKTSSEAGAIQDGAVQILAHLLQEREYRLLWWETQGSSMAGSLLDLATEHPPSLQVQYSALLCFWLASFNSSVAKALASVDGVNVVAPLLEVARTAVKEKIVRVAIAILTNLLRLAPSSAIPLLIAEHGLKISKSLSERKWADDELREDVVFLRDNLQEVYEKMTTFEEYRTELDARHLRWSPPHRNTVFWRANIDEFRKEHWSTLHILLGLLSSDDPVTQAVAAYDVGRIVDVAPDAVPVVTKAGAKVRLMQMMTSSDAEVRYEALRTTQAILGHLFA